MPNHASIRRGFNNNKSDKLVPDFTKNIKQAGDEIFTCASLCQKLSLYGIILQSYCTNKKGAIFYASQCNNNYDNVYSAVMTTKLIARVNPVHLMNVD